MKFTEKLGSMISQEVSFETVWDWLCGSQAGVFLSEMKNVRQNPAFHGEGDVYTHTKMVCRALTEEEEFARLSPRERTELFLAALLHDIGKIRTTVWQDGKWTSPYHASVGSRMARTFLWQDGLCGSPEKLEIRETVCGLIRHHMIPMRMIDHEDAILRIRQIAALGELAKDFTWRKLCMLSEADVRGRIAQDVPECEEKVELCRILVEEAGCTEGSFAYRNDFTKHAYLSGRNVFPAQFLYDDTWGEVVLMSGLPGTGKDTWITRNLEGLPMISLDDIRREKKIKPSDDQGAVVREAREQAKAFLRRKQPFVWNATSLSKEIRQKQIRLFEQYGASVKIVYLETDEDTQRKRNLARSAAVPDEVIENMRKKTEPPLPDEAQKVEWLSV